MSQKKIRKIKKAKEIGVVVEKPKVNLVGIREILKQNWIFLMFLSLGIFLLYFNSLHGAFVSDDYASIPQNAKVTDFGYMFQGFVSLSNWLLATLFGIVNVVPYHLMNLFLYIVISILGFVFLYLLFDKTIAMLSIVLFAVLPAHVEAVSWISGKPYLFNAFFVLLSLIFFIMYLGTVRKKYLYVLLLLLPLTFLAERVRSLSLLFLAILYLIFFKDKILIKINWFKILLVSFLIIFVLGIVMWPLISYRINNVNSGINSSDSIFYNPFFQYPTGIAKYLQLLLIPTDLTLYHTMFTFPVWLNWAILLTYLAMVIYFCFKNKLYSFSLLFIFLATAPSMAPVKVSWLVAERYVFLGSLGFALFLTMIILELAKISKVVPVVLIGSVILVLSIRVYMRNIDWQTNHNLWVNTCQVSPNSHNAWNNIGDDYDKLASATTDERQKGFMLANSIKGFTQSTIVKPNYADAFHNRANIFFKVGRYDLARESYNIALYFSPGLYQTYLSLVQIDLAEKKFDLALEHAQGAQKAQPNDPQSLYVMAIVQAQMGKVKEAKATLESIVRVIPNYKPAVDALAQLRSQT